MRLSLISPLLGLKRQDTLKSRHVMLCGRIRNYTIQWEKFELVQIGVGSVGRIWLVVCVSQWLVVRVNKICSLVVR